MASGVPDWLKGKCSHDAGCTVYRQKAACWPAAQQAAACFLLKPTCHDCLVVQLQAASLVEGAHRMLRFWMA